MLDREIAAIVGTLYTATNECRKRLDFQLIASSERFLIGRDCASFIC
jgi:hypothetical protein